MLKKKTTANEKLMTLLKLSKIEPCANEKYDKESCRSDDRLCHVGFTGSHSSTEFKQPWAWTVLGRETAWELFVQLALVRMLMLLRGWWKKVGGVAKPGRT